MISNRRGKSTIRAEMARRLNIDERLIIRAEAIKASDESLFDRVFRGEMTIDQAEAILSDRANQE